jgi:hypothetical protein
MKDLNELEERIKIITDEMETVDMMYNKFMLIFDNEFENEKMEESIDALDFLLQDCNRCHQPLALHSSG